MSRPSIVWVPALVMGLGGLFTVGIDTQQSLPLRAPLTTVIPAELEGIAGKDVTIPDEELAVAGVTSYLMRTYQGTSETGDTTAFSLYIGYYDRQMRGKTIHSPKNCLPGGGWEPLASQTATISTASGAATVNRYLLQRDDQQVLVLYWYQGRGRIQANEYLVKWDLLRDSALRQRSEEALVRIVVPITESEADAYAVATRVAEKVATGLATALPT